MHPRHSRCTTLVHMHTSNVSRPIASSALWLKLCFIDVSFSCLQARYILGDATHSFIPGFGKNPPTHVANQAASCPASPASCTAVNGLLNPDSNPRVLYGSLVEGYNGDTDTWTDVRSNNMTRVMVEYNAGWQGLLAGMEERSMGAWEQCLQGQGILKKDHSVCS